MKTMLETARTPSPEGTRPSVGATPPGKSPSRARDEDLGDDLGAGEIAHQRLRAGVAEGAVERAADLAGDAERAAIGFGNVDALDLGAFVVPADRGQPDQPFARAVRRDLLGDDLWTGQRVALGELFEQRPRDVAHGGKIARAAMVDPMPELGGPHAGLALGNADVEESMRQFDARRPGQGARRRREGGGGKGHGAF
jgi:hypothetical protein